MKYSLSLFYKSVLMLLTIVVSLSTSSVAFAHTQTKVDGKVSLNDEIEKLVPYMRINEEGFFVLDEESIPLSLDVSKKTIKWVQKNFAEINAHLKEIPANERPHISATGEVQLQGLLSYSGDVPQTLLSCVFVPRWVLDTIAWTAIIYGAGLVTIGLFAEGTIIGVPIGAILQAIGLWDGVSGTFMLWWVDTYYPNGINVCW